MFNYITRTKPILGILILLANTILQNKPTGTTENSFHKCYKKKNIL